MNQSHTFEFIVTLHFLFHFTVRQASFEAAMSEENESLRRNSNASNSAMGSTFASSASLRDFDMGGIDEGSVDGDGRRRLRSSSGAQGYGNGIDYSGLADEIANETGRRVLDGLVPDNVAVDVFKAYSSVKKTD
jgi:hypothetical protein